MLNGVSSDKEQWEPALAQLFELAAGSDPSHTVPIREAWALDAPNHGDSAVLNRDVLKNRPPFCAFYWTHSHSGEGS